MMRILPLIGAVVVSLFGGLLAACASDSSASSSPIASTVRVAVALYPIEDIVRVVGGDAVSVIELVPPGESAHDYEPTPQQVSRLQSADIVFYLGSGFQPSIEKAIASLPERVRKIDLLATVPLMAVSPQLAGTEGTTDGEVLANNTDPHVWLAPTNMSRMADAVQVALSDLHSGGSAAFVEGAAQYKATLSSLDATMAAGLAHCASNVIVTSHRAFGYLAQAYGLEQIAISGISPADEPSAKTLEAVATAAQQHNVGTIFFETNLPADLSRTIAEEIGATTAVLDPIESLSKDQIDARASYVSLMEQNLAALVKGLGCT